MSEKSKIVLALFLSFVITSVFQLVFGERGLIAFSDLEIYAVDLEENLQRLETIQLRLSSRFETLKSDPTTLALEARTLGYVRPGERVMKLNGLVHDPNFSFEGAILEYNSHSQFSGDFFRIFALIVALIIYGFLTVINLLLSRPRKNQDPLERK